MMSSTETVPNKARFVWQFRDPILTQEADKKNCFSLEPKTWNFPALG